MTLTFNAWQVSTSSTPEIRRQKGGLEGKNGGYAAIFPFQPAQYSECVGGRACRDLQQFAMHPGSALTTVLKWVVKNLPKARKK